MKPRFTSDFITNIQNIRVIYYLSTRNRFNCSSKNQMSWVEFNNYSACTLKNIFIPCNNNYNMVSEMPFSS